MKKTQIYKFTLIALLSALAAILMAFTFPLPLAPTFCLDQKSFASYDQWHHDGFCGRGHEHRGIDWFCLTSGFDLS